MGQGEGRGRGQDSEFSTRIWKISYPINVSQRRGGSGQVIECINSPLLPPTNAGEGNGNKCVRSLFGGAVNLIIALKLR